MKTLIATLLISSTLLLSSNIQAEPPARKIHNLLNKVMHYPDFAKKVNSTGIVYVSFETNSDGTIEVLGLNASSKKFGAYVSDRLSTLKLNQIDTSQVYNYKFTFKPEK
ncbi:MAG: hypothetical protein JKX73_02970 [Flavobacteriales bacterium]|nr:hypothetical protein [Flavobacteriales bacterium]